MDPKAIALFRELADRSPSEREAYYARHQIPAALRAEVESLLRFDGDTAESLRGPVAAVAESVLFRTPLVPGARLGPYEVIAPVGAGGMGEVYKARDTRLDRTVAIKVLPAHVASDPELKQRFEREAKMLAALSHPHICPVFDVGHQEETDFLVMEYLKGETLADRITKGPLALDQGLRHAIEIADALAKAHGAGIVHRDLKPGNIMLTRSGAKLLDFGLAKPTRPALGTKLAQLPTMSSLTEQGTILGTVQYMAPEQLEGRDADARTDIFAFGAVVYEMLTGKKAFEGRSQVSVIAAIMQADPPPISASQPLTPPLLDHLVKTCLAKDPEVRWQSAADVMRELTWIAGGASGAVAATPPVRRATMGLIVAAVSILALAAVVWYRYVVAQDTRAIRFFMSPPETTTFPSSSAFLAVSPDGLSLAFTAVDSSGKTLLWVRPLDSVSARPLSGTDDANSPFWSPDGRFVAFYAQGKLRRVNISDGSLQEICDVPDYTFTRGGAWSRNDVIVFEMYPDGGPLYRVSPSGGVPTPVTTLVQSRGERRHIWPSFLPDATHFLYSAIAPAGGGGVYVAALGSKEVRPLLNAQSNAVYASGYLLHGANGALMAQRFDAQNPRLEGERFRVADRVLYNPVIWSTVFSASETGVLAYLGGAMVMTTQLTWFDRTGKPLGSIGEPADQRAVNLSSDGMKIAVQRLNQQRGDSDIWLMDASRGTNSRLTTHPSHDALPVWSPDGARIVFASTRDDPGDHFDNLYVKMSNGSSDEQPILKFDKPQIHQHPHDWSVDGRYVLFERSDPKTTSGNDLWIVPASASQTPFPFLQTEFNELAGHFSPDGQFVTYTSNETGRFEVYVRSFSGSAGKWQISTSGGAHPRWRRDGKEIFYTSPDSALMGVGVNTKGRFEAGSPSKLFDVPIRVYLPENPDPYDVAPDGQRFLVMARDEAISDSITVTINWTAALSPQK